MATQLIPGHATEEGTARFEGRFGDRLPGHFRTALRLRLSSIGLGTYLGEPTAECDDQYREALIRAVELGVNVVDTASNYRHQRSERAVGAALAAMIESGSLRRDEIFLATKGGFLTFDAEEPADPAAYFDEKLIRPGLVRSEDVVAGCHAMSPKYLESQIDASRKNLGIETIDIYYLHNPETQLHSVKHEEFYRRLEGCFAAFEKAVQERKIKCYGTATWNAYRAGREGSEVIFLTRVLDIAQRVGGKDHHFKAIQFPLNLAMPEALTKSTQPLEDARVPILQVARKRGLAAFASASLLQGKLTSGLPAEIQEKLPGLRTDAQRAIQFVRSTPGVTSALVGMSHLEHVDENLETARVPPLTLEEFRKIFASGGSTPAAPPPA